MSERGVTESVVEDAALACETRNTRALEHENPASYTGFSWYHPSDDRPEWESEDDEWGGIKVVMTGSASDPPDWQAHIRNKPRREALANRFRGPVDPLRIVLHRSAACVALSVYAGLR